MNKNSLCDFIYIVLVTYWSLIQSVSRGSGIAAIYKSNLGSNITFKRNFDITYFDVVQASVATAQHTTFFRFVPPTAQLTKQSY